MAKELTFEQVKLGLIGAELDLSYEGDDSISEKVTEEIVEETPIDVSIIDTDELDQRLQDIKDAHKDIFADEFIEKEKQLEFDIEEKVDKVVLRTGKEVVRNKETGRIEYILDVEVEERVSE